MQTWKWIDEKNGIGWSVSVPVETGMDNELDSMEVVKADAIRDYYIVDDMEVILLYW